MTVLASQMYFVNTKIRYDDQKRFVICIISLMCWINPNFIGMVAGNSPQICHAFTDIDYWPHQNSGIIWFIRQEIITYLLSSWLQMRKRPGYPDGGDSASAVEGDGVTVLGWRNN